MSISGHIFATLAGDPKCIFIPDDPAVVANRKYSVRRSGVVASRRQTVIFQPISSPVSVASLLYRSTEYFSTLVMLADHRNCPTNPAACQVDPEVSFPCSSNTTSAL